ncbi:glucosamine-6-phosphate deaminase [Verrucomicrobiota bacterium]
MEVIIRPDIEAATELTARLIIDAVKQKPNLTLGLATGRTMEHVYGKIAQACSENNLHLAECKTFNLDEYIGIPENHPGSYRTYMNKHLFSKTDIKINNTNLPNGMAEDQKAEAQRYEELIKKAGGIDLQLLGIGMSGHIGFNEPLSALFSRTRDKALTQTTIDQNSPLFDNPDEMPKRAFTMGVGTILDSKRIIMLVTGKAKADILAKAVEGPVTAMISATAIQLHATTTVIVDEDAATKLEGKDYYRWLFENEPEWELYR